MCFLKKASTGGKIHIFLNHHDNHIHIQLMFLYNKHQSSLSFLNPLFIMGKHKPICLVMMLITLVGSLNWGLVGLGGFLKMNLNLVNLLLGSWPTVEWVVYLLVGVCGTFIGYMGLMNKDCGCMKMDKK